MLAAGSPLQTVGVEEATTGAFGGMGGGGTEWRETNSIGPCPSTSSESLAGSGLKCSPITSKLKRFCWGYVVVGKTASIFGRTGVGGVCPLPEITKVGRIRTAALNFAHILIYSDHHRVESISHASYSPAISAAAISANSISSNCGSPLTATAPITLPSFRTGTPPPQPVNLGSPK